MRVPLRIITRRLVAAVTLIVVSVAIAGAQGNGGNLRVTSFPDGARISIDGVDTGKITPATVQAGLGPHLVRVPIADPAWVPASTTFTVAGGNNEVDLVMVPVLTTGMQGPEGDTGPQGPPGPQGCRV